MRVATVDWPRVIREIRHHGMQAQAIARRVGVAPTTLHNLAGGATREPCYSVGVALLALHDKVKP